MHRILQLFNRQITNYLPIRVRLAHATDDMIEEVLLVLSAPEKFRRVREKHRPMSTALFLVSSFEMSPQALDGVRTCARLLILERMFAVGMVAREVLPQLFGVVRSDASVRRPAVRDQDRAGKHTFDDGRH